MQHITTTSSNTINTVKNSFTTDPEIIHTTINGICKNSPKSLNSSPIPCFKSQSKKIIVVDRVIISDDNIIKNRPNLCLRKQPSPSKIQRLKRTLSLKKKPDKEEEEEEEEEQEEVIDNTCDNSFSLFATTTSYSSKQDNQSQSFIMSHGSSIIKNHSTDNALDNNNDKSSSHSPLRRLSRSITKNNNSGDTITSQSEKKCIRKRVKSNSSHRCTFSSSSSSSSLVETTSFEDSSITCSSPSSSISTTDSIPESRDNHRDVKIKCRNSMDDQIEFDIRRSWSHIEVRHFKGLFKRNRHSSDVQRRNSYAYTSSQRTNLQMASDSEYKVLNRIRNVKNTKNTNDISEESSSDVEQPSPKKFPVDLFALQADMEKETDVLTRSRQMRKFIISEIYSTEQSYLSHMKTLKKTFMDPCITSTSSPLINKDDIRTIFAHLEDLIKLSDTIVETLETSMDPWEVYDSKLGHVFLKFAEDFDVYKKYAENIQRSRQLLSKRVNQSLFYRRFVSSQRKKENIKLGLNDYMIMPIQRVARYSLLLKDLKKYTVETHSDYNDLCKALDSMIFLATECNNSIRDI